MSTRYGQTFVNAKVFTGRSEDDFASAFTGTDGVVTWVGHTDDIDTIDAVDLDGRTVLPGLIDVHCHPSAVAQIVDAVPCMQPDVTSIPEMIAALKIHRNAGKGATDWIEGWGYDESKLAEHRTPTREDLDQISTTQPVFVLRSDFHSAVCNARALALAGVTRDTPDPAGARVGRDEHGEPNGILTELAAVELVRRVIGARDQQSQVAGIVGVGERYNERGIVAVTDMMVPSGALAVYRDAEAGGFRHQAALYVDWHDIVARGTERVEAEQRIGRTKIAGVKLFADGTVSGRTAWLSEPYPGSDERGISMLDEPTIQAAYDFAARNGVQISVHAMGDAALQQVVEFFAGKTPWMAGDTPSVRLEHASLLSEDQMRQMRDATMTFGAAAQIIFTFAEYDSYYQNLSAELFARTYPVRSCYELVPHVGLSSDAPATTWADPDNVFVSIQAAVTRTAYNGADIGADQAITVPQAVLLYTARAATVAPYEGRIGRIAEGYEGRFVVLDRDIFTVAPHEIGATSVAATWIRGDCVYQLP